MEADRRDLSGAELVAAVTHLLQRTRLEDPTYGVWESSDPQWWWRRPRKTDTWAMPVWFDAEGPVGAVMATDWDDAIAIDCFVLPGRSDLVDQVCDVGLGVIEAHPEATFEVMVDDDDSQYMEVLRDGGFRPLPEKGVSAWVEADEVRLSELALDEGYRIASREELWDRSPHHFVAANGDEVEARLQSTSLYRPDLDLVVVTDDGEVAAYALFWLDPLTGVGFVEPVGTTEAHRRRGLARTIVGEGLRLLTRKGAKRLKVNYNDANAAAKRLYLGFGFTPTMATSLWVRRPPRLEAYTPGTGP